MAPEPQHYEPTLESVRRYPLPDWYQDAKLGIFVHWGLYSVPGWAASRPRAGWSPRGPLDSRAYPVA